MCIRDSYCADYGTIVLELADDVDVSAALAETGAYELGQTTAEQEIRVNGIAVSIKEAEKAYTTPLEKIFPTQTKKVKGEVSYAPVSYTHLLSALRAARARASPHSRTGSRRISGTASRSSITMITTCLLYTSRCV